MSLIYINSKLTGDSFNPTIHTYAGKFRKLLKDLNLIGASIVQCSCGSLLHSVVDVFCHYDEAHFDIPQFVSINLQSSK